MHLGRLNSNIEKTLEAKRSNLRIIEPGPREIQIDLDGIRRMRHYADMFGIFKREGLARGWKERVIPSRARNHFHVIITLPRPLPLAERVGLAAILGDDPARAAFNYCRVKTKSKYPVVLFQPKR